MEVGNHAARTVLLVELPRASGAWFRDHHSDHHLWRAALAKCFVASESTRDRGGHRDLCGVDRAVADGRRTHAR